MIDIPYDGKHRCHRVPHLVGNDNRILFEVPPIYALRSGILLAHKMDCNIRGFRFRQIYIKCGLNFLSQASCRLKRSSPLKPRKQVVIERHKIALFNTRYRHGDVHKQILVCKRIDSPVTLLERFIDQLGNKIEPRCRGVFL